MLELDHQLTRLVEARNRDLDVQIHRCGRAAGRSLGCKIRIFASDPDRREDQRIVVGVLVTDSNPDDENRIRERSDLLISHLQPDTRLNPHAPSPIRHSATPNPLRPNDPAPSRHRAASAVSSHTDPTDGRELVSGCVMAPTKTRIRAT